jgi:CO dehydrogenase/acetyl-CoA synthase delta subunit
MNYNFIKMTQKKKEWNWRETLMSFGIVPKEAKMLFEIDDANGTKLIFPEANDITEIQEGTTVTADNGEYVFTDDAKTYKITVDSGKVSAIEITEEQPEEEQPIEMKEVLQSFADEFHAKDLQVKELESTVAEMKTEITQLKALMSHGKDDEVKKTVTFGGKKIDFDKLNKK